MTDFTAVLLHGAVGILWQHCILHATSADQMPFTAEDSAIEMYTLTEPLLCAQVLTASVPRGLAMPPHAVTASGTPAAVC